MRRSNHVACVAVLVCGAVAAGAASSGAQSLSDVASSFVTDSASVGSWTTVTAPDPPKPSIAPATFDHWQANITSSKQTPEHPGPAPASSGSPPERPYALHGPAPAAEKHMMKGLASFYGKGKRTAAGEAFDPSSLTAAHRTLPFGTHVRVTRVDTGESVVVRINDRGPFKPGRVIDLSQKAAEDLRMTDKGLTAVKLEVLDREEALHPQEIAQRSLRR